MKKNNIIISSILIILCFLAYFETYSFNSKSRIFPRIILISLLLLTITFIFETIKNYKNKEEKVIKYKKRNYEGLKILLYVLLGNFLYIISINYIGFYLDSYIFIVFMMFFLGFKKIPKLLLISSLFLFFLYTFFALTLKVPTPRGIFY